MILSNYYTLFFFFFFQAEDGIRDLTVTGVQTCALPIFDPKRIAGIQSNRSLVDFLISDARFMKLREVSVVYTLPDAWATAIRASQARSEERRVGKECRSRWSPYH